MEPRTLLKANWSPCCSMAATNYSGSVLYVPLLFMSLATWLTVSLVPAVKGSDLNDLNMNYSKDLVCIETLQKLTLSSMPYLRRNDAICSIVLCSLRPEVVQRTSCQH
jgi:hypothetical protein